MSIFKKEIEEDEELDDKKIDSSLKDLKPENRKKRKEPPKPWGKKERQGILLFFLLTVAVAVILSLASRSWKLPGFPRISFPDIHLFTTKTFVVTPSGKPDVLKYWNNKETEIINYFESATKELTGNYTFYFQDLTDNYAFGTRENEIMTAASLIKLPVLATLYQEAEKGLIDLEQKYVLKAADKIGGSGSLYNQPAGTVLSYRQLAQLMANQSDNTAFNVIRKLLGDEKINETITKLGMVDTSLAENETSAKDIGLFFAKLYQGEIMNSENQEELIKALTGTSYEAWIARDIKDVIVAHKFGREINVTNDGGIIFANHPFVLVIMSEGIVYRESDEAIPSMAFKIYSLVDN